MIVMLGFPDESEQEDPALSGIGTARVLTEDQSQMKDRNYTVWVRPFIIMVV